MAIQEMHEMTGLPEGDYPYEEFVPNQQELRELKEQFSTIYDVHWVVMFRCFIYGVVHRKRGYGILPLTWAKYLFPGFDVGSASKLSPSTDVMIRLRAQSSTFGATYTSFNLEGDFAQDMVFSELSPSGEETDKGQSTPGGVFDALPQKICGSDLASRHTSGGACLPCCVDCLWRQARLGVGYLCEHSFCAEDSDSAPLFWYKDSTKAQYGIYIPYVNFYSNPSPLMFLQYSL